MTHPPFPEPDPAAGHVCDLQPVDDRPDIARAVCLFGDFDSGIGSTYAARDAFNRHIADIRSAA